MTDSELRDAAVAELKKTTQGYLKSNSQPRALVGVQWKKGLDLLAQIGVVAEPPPPPPSGDWYPPSWVLNGPLGNKVPLPPKKGAFLGSWFSMPGGAITWEQHKIRVAQREADIGRKYDFIMITDWPDLWPDQKLKWIHDHGALPCVGELNFPGRNVTDVKNGAVDAQIDAYADHWKALGFTIMVRLFHEFDSTGYIHSAVGREADWVSAWKRIVDRVKARGATNVGWWWCPNEGVNRATIAACYPGDTYVDWVGSDLYNFCAVGAGGCWVTPMHSGWAEFWELVNYPDGPGYRSMYATYGPRKPFVIGETNCVHDPNHPTKKGDWYRAIPAAARNMPYLAGIDIFDQDFSGRGDTLVDYPTSVPQVYEGYKAFARDPYFNTRSSA